jgi:asparagine synthase (glutamine-hydrolysing)
VCGIAGYIGSKQITNNRIQSCLKHMQRRGPDASGDYHHHLENGRHIHLLHSRLAIIDLDARANQPFLKHDKVLVFNGELYNYIEVRQSLEKHSHRFQTDCDTEVLSAALERWGSAALDRCEGMWAFAYFDENTDHLMLCRDRFGEKPLYLYETSDGLFFASEPKFIFTLSGMRPKPNYRQLHRYLINGYKSLYKQPSTFFEGLKELPSGRVLIMDPNGAYRMSAYWTPICSPEPDMSYAEAVDGARMALINAMKIRLRADNPLAFCMSGGVDSNALISVACRQFNYEVHGFTIVNTDSRYEEQDLVEHSVAQLKIKHTAVSLDRDDFLEGMRELVRYHDAPVFTITYYVHWLLMRSVHAQGYRICVSGTAADELFSGYYDHHSFYLAQICDDPKLYARSLENWKTHIRPIVRNPLLQDPECFRHDPDARDHIYLDSEIFAGCLHKPWREEFFETRYSDDLLRNRMLNELFHEATPVILHEDDLNAMYYSIENRSPYLDRSLFEHCYKIPTRHLIQNGAAKAVLRDAMQGIVPDRILDNRRKVGFNAPIHDLIDVNDPGIKKHLLEDSPIFEHVKRDRVATILATGGHSNSESKFLFNFLSSKLFLEEFDA